jgi:hypothetical protein
MDGPQATAPPPKPGKGVTSSNIAGEVLARAEAIVDGLSVEFPAHASRDLRQLEQTVALMAGFGQATDPYYSEISRIAHDIRGQGALFGYPLLSRLAGTLCLAMRTLEPQDGAIMTIIDSHVAGMRALLDHSITGAEDRSALTIVTALELLVHSRARR